jgi:hypothetical protein
MKKSVHLLLVFLLCYSLASSQSDFVAGANLIFQDDFSRDPVGDFPAKWNTNGEGQVVEIDNEPGKWLKIMQPTAVSPDLKKPLPENCTIEFDLYLKGTSGAAPYIMFGLTSLSNVSSGEVYRRRISATLQRYSKSGSILYAKNIQKLGERKFALEGYVDRVLHVSMSINKTRLRVYLGDEKVIDLPKVLTPEFRNNFFIASSVVIPYPDEGVYISNIKIAAGEADARSLLIKQLLEEGTVVTDNIQFTGQSNEFSVESLPLLDGIGQTLQANPDMNIQINSIEETISEAKTMFSKDALKKKADKIKSYLVSKFKLKVNRIVTDAKVKVDDALQKENAEGGARQVLTEIIRL